ncbi:MAG: SPOR domain-containing protein, partial [Muribaculaceae bacterium]|nr:SPOR domain-containing protein [Muribaculaceae bacterium]
TENSLAELCAFLLKKFGLTSEDIIRHYDVTGKQCPLYWSPTKYQSAEVANARFKAFKDKVAGLLAADKPDASAKYYVQVGAFATKSYAETFLKDVKKTYPDAFIKKVGELYYVQVGAFASKANAEAYLVQVKKKYPDAFVKVF